MKISPQVFPAQAVNMEKKNSKSEMVLDELPKNANQVLKEKIQRQVNEAQEALMNTGEDNPKAQSLISKFKSGKKLSPSEMNYIRKHAPAMVGYIERITKEREMIELGMKMAPTKTDVQMVVYRASKQIEKHQEPEEREIRAKHLADAKLEYEKTEEYKQKPNTPLDMNEKRPSSKLKMKNIQKDANYSVALDAYQKTASSNISIVSLPNHHEYK